MHSPNKPSFLYLWGEGEGKLSLPYLVHSDTVTSINPLELVRSSMVHTQVTSALLLLHKMPPWVESFTDTWQTGAGSALSQRQRVSRDKINYESTRGGEHPPLFRWILVFRHHLWHLQGLMWWSRDCKGLWLWSRFWKRMRGGRRTHSLDWASSRGRGRGMGMR